MTSTVSSVACQRRVLMSTLMNIAGQRFGRLIALERVPNYAPKKTRWRCRCDCGTEITVLAYHLRASKIRSCGCLNRDLLKARAIHGESRHLTTEYGTWKAMLSRCYNPNDKRYSDWG